MLGAALPRPYRFLCAEQTYVTTARRSVAPLRAAKKTTALTARRAWPVLGIGMDHASTAVVSAP
ncbi:hypothetical protein BRL81_13550, partial [Xanthomonas oryzae pv. oryzae]